MAQVPNPWLEAARQARTPSASRARWRQPSSSRSRARSCSGSSRRCRKPWRRRRDSRHGE
eukprot:5407504-Pyramimonas_sp.AAC.1